jgi:adenosylcobinamide amidohydrolase
MATEVKQEKVKELDRKPVQIATATTNTGQVVLFALCDDGTIHMTRPTTDIGWAQVKKL